jgi:hypothetical protein
LGGSEEWILLHAMGECCLSPGILLGMIETHGFQASQVWNETAGLSTAGCFAWRSNIFASG